MNRPSRRWAERIYGLVVALYPRTFRERYGPAMRLVFHDLLQDPDMPAWRIWLSVLRDLRDSFLQEHLASLREGLSMTRHRSPSSALLRRGPVFWCAVVLTWILSWITFRSFDLSGGDEISVLGGFGTVMGGFGIVMGALGLGIAVVGLAIAVLTRSWPRDRFGLTPPRE
jgi:hypothetical protein